MCRFIAYIGKPITLAEALFKPKNSLIKQSIRAQETDERLNGDGFGIGWYAHEIDFQPGVFASIQPAWNDRNLKHIAPKIVSDCFFAHVRSASSGDVSLVNCHPFNYDRWLFMHNGGIAGFKEIKRHLRRLLSDPIYDWLQGQTDSEHFFALFLDNFYKRSTSYTVENMAAVMEQSMKELFKLQEKYNIRETTYLNVALTDGKSVLAMRYISNLSEQAPTLFYSSGSTYTCDEHGTCHMLNGERPIGAVLIASEKLSSHRAQWHEVPVNHMLFVHEDLTTSLKEINL